LVRAAVAAGFVRRWQPSYLDVFSPRKPLASFVARPAPAATELDFSE
jgi:hypothetical protein